MDRSGFLTATACLIAAPAIVRAGILMPVNVQRWYPDPNKWVKTTVLGQDLWYPKADVLYPTTAIRYANGYVANTAPSYIEQYNEFGASNYEEFIFSWKTVLVDENCKPKVLYEQREDGSENYEWIKLTAEDPAYENILPCKLRTDEGL